MKFEKFSILRKTLIENGSINESVKSFQEYKELFTEAANQLEAEEIVATIEESDINFIGIAAFEDTKVDEADSAGNVFKNIFGFMRIKSLTNKYTKAMVDEAIADMDFKRKKAASETKEETENLKEAHALKKATLTDNTKALGEKIDNLGTTDFLKNVAKRTKLNARLKKNQILLKIANKEETKELKLSNKKITDSIATADGELREYEKENKEEIKDATKEAAKKLKEEVAALETQISDVQKKIDDQEDKLGTATTESTINEAMISPSGAKGLRSGHKIKTQNGTYTITGFGSQTNATKDFEATNEKGKKFNLRVSLRGARGIQVAAAPSLNFPEKEEMLESIVNEESVNEAGKLKVGKEDFSFLLKLNDKELVKKLDSIRNQQAVNAKQYMSARSKGDDTSKIEKEGESLANQERAVIEARIRVNESTINEAVKGKAAIYGEIAKLKAEKAKLLDSQLEKKNTYNQTGGEDPYSVDGVKDEITKLVKDAGSYEEKAERAGKSIKKKSGEEETTTDTPGEKETTTDTPGEKETATDTPGEKETKATPEEIEAAGGEVTNAKTAYDELKDGDDKKGIIQAKIKHLQAQQKLSKLKGDDEETQAGFPQEIEAEMQKLQDLDKESGAKKESVKSVPTSEIPKTKKSTMTFEEFRSSKKSN